MSQPPVITYTPGTPNATDPIPSTQQPIQNNFLSLNQQFGVDHLPLTSSTPYGYHNKATLVQQSAAPTAVSLADILYTISAGTPAKTELYMLRSSGDGGAAIQLTDFAGGPVINNPGSTFLPGGIILNWGTVSATTSGATATFASAFPNICWGVVISVDTSTSNPSGNVAYVTSGDISKTGFKAWVTSSARTCFWFAIGN